MKTNNNNRGMSILFILIFGFVVILVLSYFNISLQMVVESPDAQDNLHYVGGAGKSIWVEYLQEPASYLWNDVWVDIFWKGFILNMERIHDGKPTELDNGAPTVGF